MLTPLFTPRENEVVERRISPQGDNFSPRGQNSPLGDNIAPVGQILPLGVKLRMGLWRRCQAVSSLLAQIGFYGSWDRIRQEYGVFLKETKYLEVIIQTSKS
jgi:hypothetical protein